MSKINYLRGSLINLALEGTFDVIAQGCNCFCVQGKGLAPQMDKAFGTKNPNLFLLESHHHKGDIDKLGRIESVYGWIQEGKFFAWSMWTEEEVGKHPYLEVVNCYTQYHYDLTTKPFDYEAFTLCMRKINKRYPNKHIGLPMIGSHLAGGDWDRIEKIIEQELSACSITVVEWDGK